MSEDLKKENKAKLAFGDWMSFICEFIENLCTMWSVR